MIRKDLAVCIYFASYLSPRNESSKAFIEAMSPNPHLTEFMQALEADAAAEIRPRKKFLNRLIKDYDFYLRQCDKAENSHKLAKKKLVYRRKFFSMVWLVCSNALLDSE